MDVCVQVVKHIQAGLSSWELLLYSSLVICCFLVFCLASWPTFTTFTDFFPSFLLSLLWAISFFPTHPVFFKVCWVKWDINQELKQLYVGSISVNTLQLMWPYMPSSFKEIFWILVLQLLLVWLLGQHMLGLTFGLWAINTQLLLSPDGSIDSSTSRFMSWSIWILAAVLIFQVLLNFHSHFLFINHKSFNKNLLFTELHWSSTCCWSINSADYYVTHVKEVLTGFILPQCVRQWVVTINLFNCFLQPKSLCSQFSLVWLHIYPQISGFLMQVEFLWAGWWWIYCYESWREFVML